MGKTLIAVPPFLQVSQVWYIVSAYFQILQIPSGIFQGHVRNKKYFNSFVSTKKSIIYENNN